MPCFILDGYNIIKGSEKFYAKDISLRIEKLIRFLIEQKPQGSYKNKVVVVFDGSPQISYSNYINLKSYNIQIIFSYSQTADEKIKKIAETTKNPKDFIVVSDDKEIVYYVKYCGLRVLSVKEFIKEHKQSKKFSYRKLKGEDKFNCPVEELNDITKELKEKFKI
ncbi:MAG: NYN domain-containing protein [Endomicrobiia bacterium]